MVLKPLTLIDHLKKTVRSASFWVILAVLTAVSLLHYCTPQERSVAAYSFTRHTFERVLYIIASVSAAFTMGHGAGLVTLGLVVLLMMPRALFISPTPADASVEVIAMTVLGYLVISTNGARQRAVARLKTSNAATVKLIRSLEPKQTLGDVLDLILQALGIEAGAIFLLDEEGQELVLTAHKNLPPEVVSCQDGSKAARILANQGCLSHQLAIPLSSRGSVNGVLVLADRHPSPVLRREEKLVATICRQVSMVVENARLFQSVGHQLRIEQSVYDVVDQITSELELDRVLPRVVQIAEELLGADGGVISLWDEDLKIITWPCIHNLPRELGTVTAQREEGMSGEVMRTGRPVLVNDYQSYPNAIPAFAKAGLTSAVAVPIVSGSRTFGALVITTVNRAKRFSDQDVSVLKVIGRQTGIAIENAYLYDNLRFYARRITRAQENERRRISRELHDDTIQSLIVLTRRMEILAGSDKSIPKLVSQNLRELREFTGDIIQRLRRFSHDLRPSVLDDLGLLPALEEVTDALNARPGLTAEFKAAGSKRRLSSEAELALFRIAQEALSNVAKHSRASYVICTLEFSHDAARLSVEDNGVGFVPPRLSGRLTSADKLGLIGMYERARLVGGTLSVESAPGQGTRVVARLPI